MKLASLVESSYLMRYILFNVVDISDYNIFPARQIHNSHPVFDFARTETSDLLSLNLNLSITLDQFLEQNERVAFLVIKNDQLLVERYYNGYQRSSICTSFSTCKSFVSAMVGIALHEKLIHGLDDSIIKYLPELSASHWSDITIRHLVSMSSGLKYNAGFFPWVDDPRVYYSLDLRSLARQARKQEQPGTRFHYNNYNLILLGMILERITGETVSKYLQEKIWKPIGMEYPASWSLDSEQSGMEKMESGLNARAIDFAKFGRLYLRCGSWNGKQIIPEAWVIKSTSLENNLIGESTQRTIYVYLPPSYTTSEKHYPVIYYLPGFGDSQMIGFNPPDDMNALIEKGQAKEMIIVVVNGTNKLGGSFFVNSPMTGNWEDFVVHDVINYIDSHYRTLPTAASRGITGHSMGGFGALNLAMLHPDVFGAVYSMSPGLFDENGLAESQMFADEALIKSFIDYIQEVLAMPMEETATALFLSPQQFASAYGHAFAPHPSQHPPYYDYPYSEVNGQLVRDDAVWKRWNSGYGGIADKVAQYKDNLLELKGIVVDYGTEDAYVWIPKGCSYFGNQLSAAGIPVKLEAFDGGHQNELGIRISDYMLPFFSSILTFE